MILLPLPRRVEPGHRPFFAELKLAPMKVSDKSNFAQRDQSWHYSRAKAWS
jgi:hypothetical protein